MMKNETQCPWSEWMRFAQKGDQEAYKKLLQDIGPKVLRWIRYYVRDEQAVQDLYQEVFLHVHRARHTYDPERSFKAWLYSLTRNTVLDHFRKSKRSIQYETLIENIFESTPLENETEECELLQKALASLPEQQRTAVELIKLKGLSMEQAAQMENISLSAMKVRAHRGYIALERLLSLQERSSHAK